MWAHVGLSAYARALESVVAERWEQRWQDGNTPWDADAPSPTVIAVAPSLPMGQALVPGCGSGNDVFALVAPDRHVTGLDLAPSSSHAFVARRDSVGVSAASATLAIGDFFGDEWRADAEPFDLVWDYTFLCALDPSQRPAWAKRMAELIRPEGVLATLLFPVMEAPPEYEGPPWPLDPDAIVATLDGKFRLVSLESVSQSLEGREGKEWLALFERI